MSYSLKLLIAVGIGAVAACLNWMAVTAGTHTFKAVCITEPVRKGELFDGRFGELDLPASFENLRQTLVVNPGLMPGHRAMRDFERGDVIFLRDIQPHGAELDLRDGEVVVLVSMAGKEPDYAALRIGMEIRLRFALVADQATGTKAFGPDWVGPFRIVTLGDMTTNATQGGKPRGTINVIGVAVRRTKDSNDDPKFKLLDQFCDQQSANKAKLLGFEILQSSIKDAPRNR